jgi:hypothetical protein
MAEREAACTCGQLKIMFEGDPVLVSSCCCTRCQRRTGSYFGVTAYFPPAQMTSRVGEAADFRRPGGESTSHFCPRCGSTVWWEFDDATMGLVGVAGGCFADPTLPGPHRMTFTATGHPFVTSPKGIPTYEDGPPE